MPKGNQPPIILWLASWYPSILDPLVGDFIQRQAEALSMILKLEVWTIIDDPRGEITHGHTTTSEIKGNLIENRLFIYTGMFAGTPLYKYWKVFKFLTLGYKVINKYYSQRKKPAIIHTHILMYLGIIGQKLSRKWKIPHAISEQWTAYLPEAKPNIREFNIWSKWKMKQVLRHAKVITAVSNYLAGILKNSAAGIEVFRIPNVVNGALFKPQLKDNLKFRFITISAQSYQKNLDDILKAIKILQDFSLSRPFELIIVHHPDPELERLVKSLKIESFVRLVSPMSHAALAELMGSCDAMVLYSRYETFGCVVIEALACGLPVVVADIPVLRELVQHEENGWLVPPESPMDLADRMKMMVEGQGVIDGKKVRDDVLQKYEYIPVGRQFQALYKKIGIIDEFSGQMPQY